MCAESLVRARWRELSRAPSIALRWAGAGLRRAAAMARIHDDSANSARWESEAVEYVRLSEAAMAVDEPSSQEELPTAGRELFPSFHSVSSSASKRPAF